MKFKIENKIEKEYSKDGVTKKYISADLVSETGERFEKVGAFNGEFSADIWYGEIQKNPKGYWNLITPKKSAVGAFKSRQIEDAMQKKSENIAKAQDRSAWMWAKRNASEILSGFYQGANINEIKLSDISLKVMQLATLIYNGEPTEPFSSPTREYTAQDRQNQKEAAEVFQEPLTDEELESLSNIPF